MQTASVDRIRTQIEQMKKAFSETEEDLAAITVPRSSWCAAAHFDHIIKVAHGTLLILAKPEPPAAPRGLNLIGRLLLALGWMPRGRAQSPDRLRGSAVTLEELQASLAELENVLERVASRTVTRPNMPILRHPTFGGLTHAQALRFVRIHTDHHLKIVQKLIR